MLPDTLPIRKQSTDPGSRHTSSEDDDIAWLPEEPVFSDDEAQEAAARPRRSRDSLFVPLRDLDKREFESCV